MHFRSVRFPDEPASGRFLAADGQHGPVIRPSVCHVPPTLPPFPDTSEGIGLPGIDSLGCWSW